MNESELETLKENYTHMIIDGMDMDTLITFAFDSIMENIETWNEEEVKAEIVDLYGEETLKDLSPDSSIKVSYSDTMKPAS
jgi:hypothetical protein|tara:strand:- start:47594 stop:47836 length:243 start_codon:yes stop_codon:yes gene_type:complete